MKNLFILLLSLSFTWTASAQKKEQQKVRAAFESYQKAILNGRGEEAIKFVDSRTLSYYSDILISIKGDDSTAIEALGILDKLMVLTIRHRATKEDILSFDGKGLLK